MKPYTYLIVHKTTGRWYYGVRYARGCDPSDLGKSYFTSSIYVKRIIDDEGPGAFLWSVRRVFDNAQSAKRWEHKVLRRMRVITNPMCINMSNSEGPPAMYGEHNPTKRTEVRAKLSNIASNRSAEQKKYVGYCNTISRRRKLFFKIFPKIRDKTIPLSRKSVIEIKKCIELMDLIDYKYTRIFKLLIDTALYIEDFLSQDRKIHRKPYPKNRKSSTRKGQSKRPGGKFFKNPIDGEARLFYNLSEVPDGWVPGLHTDENKRRISRTGKPHKESTKELMSKAREGKVFYTSPDLREYRSFVVGDQPEGWIRGIKVFTRNDKISKNNRWTKNE